jgi:hypothetical protein
MYAEEFYILQLHSSRGVSLGVRGTDGYNIFSSSREVNKYYKLCVDTISRIYCCVDETSNQDKDHVKYFLLQ